MTAPQLDLFAPAPPVPGLRLADDFLSPQEESAVIARLAAEDLTPFKFQGWEGKRLTASFGYSYDFARGRIAEAPPLPAWLLPLRARAASFAGLAPEALRQALLIRYDPGAGIGWHRDRPQFDKVIGISLGSAVVLRLRRRVGASFERRAVPLAPRSIYLLDGEVRREWEHSIAAVPGTRLSITFRSLRLSPRPPEMASHPPDPTGIHAFQRLDPRTTTSGRLRDEDLAGLAAIGVREVVNLALDSHPEALADEAGKLAALGIGYTHIPVPFDDPRDAHYRAFVAALAAAGDAPVHVHCIMNYRVSAFFFRWHREFAGMDEPRARGLMAQQWEPDRSARPETRPWAEFLARTGI